jgi:hypothetical protein
VIVFDGGKLGYPPMKKTASKLYTLQRKSGGERRKRI